jgi:ATP-dependent Clp protease, protease subunit
MPKKLNATINEPVIEESAAEYDPGDTDLLAQNGVYVFAEDFTKLSVAKCIKFILQKNFEVNTKKHKGHITLILMSEGGDLNACFGLIDVMKGSKVPVHTVGLGSISSSALFAFMAGQPGNRTITPNTSLLSHQFSWSNGGKAHELIAMSSEVERTEKRLISHIKSCSHLKTEEEIRKYLLPPSDVYLDARDAVKLGVADRISSYYPYK